MPRLSSFTNQLMINSSITRSAVKLLDYANTGNYVLPASFPSAYSFSSTQQHYGIAQSIKVTSASSSSLLHFSGISSWASWPVTIEFWEYSTWSGYYFCPLGVQNPSTTKSVGTLLADSSLSSNNFLWSFGNELGFSPSLSPTGYPLNQWNHVAYVIYSSTSNTTSADSIQYYLNGVQHISATGLASANQPTGTTQLTIGGFYDVGSGGFGAGYSGYISEIRISNNRRYTTAFTPPSSAFTIDSNTIGLVKYSPT